MMTLAAFIKSISENYAAEIYEGQVELAPFNNMQHGIIGFPEVRCDGEKRQVQRTL